MSAGALLPGVPLALGLIGLLLPPGDGGREVRRVAAALGVAGAATVLAVSLILLFTVHGTAEWSREWVRFGDVTVTAGTSIGPAALYVTLAVSVVALAVQVYSIGYLHDDPRYAPYAAQVSLFTGAMLLVVTSGDLLLLLIGWEVMGVCSYLLIGHDRRLPEAPRAAVKAFVVTRVGDVGFLLGVALLAVSAGTTRLTTVLNHHYPATTLTAALILLLAGVAGKSAQFPLHTWLPDAMAGPTPISALIHAATMVAAGVYVVFRLYPLFERAPAALAVLGVVAAVTLLLGALAATAEDDIKRVLAWSTVSQLGYMTGALAVGSPGAALFHLLTHAAFKALLFLAAGAVIHAVGTNSMSRMGGLREHMPVTFWSMAVGLAALAGVPPLSGFWSKENVLVAAAHATEGGGPAPIWVGWVVWIAALAGVAITAWYATRLLLRTFFGAPRAGEWAVGFDDARYERGSPAPHDPPAVMRWPVMLLAVAAAVRGLAAYLPAFRTALELEAPHLGVSIVLPMVLLVLGSGAAWWLWQAAPGTDPAAALGPLGPVFANGFYLDAVQDRVVVRPVRALAGLVRTVDEGVVDGAVDGTGASTTRLGAGVAAVHRAALPWAATMVFAGALLLGVAAAIYGVAT